MSNLRMQKISGLIQEALGDIIRKIKDPRIGFITITGVDVSPDLELAKVYVSVLADEKERELTLEGLESATSYVRRELGREIKLRKTPKVVFVNDPGIERASRLIKLIDDLNPRGEEK